ncbi:MAG TPA: Xaa-Pro peptidase family protein [Solirubrobacteraceae bacterium]|nr:Xaa-Pro peptidase family protein [Solirubrobacteraceae bacterium]
MSSGAPLEGVGEAARAISPRVERLAAQLRERKLDLLLISTPVDVRYLTGFTGSNGVALVAASEHGSQRFLTDFRYETQAAEQVPDVFAREIVAIDLLEAAVRKLEPRSAAVTGKLGFDDSTTTVKQHSRLRELLPSGWELSACGGLVAALREVKDEDELARIRAAAALADTALREVLEQGLVGRSEREVAIELELRMRRLGAECPSFPSIVAAGPHSALPHAEPRAVAIPKDTLLTIDWGAQLEGYCSDCTRTFATGRLSEEAREVYELVRHAQAEALAALRPGPSGREIDAVARSSIEDAGHGEHFGHGLGHGVGLEVHEAPRLSRTAGEQPLRAGNVVTVEPGVYLPGRFGVRIEDLVVVRAGGGESLSALSKELTEVS